MVPNHTIGVRQGCLLFPTLLNILLERITADVPEDHEGTVNIGGGTITNLCFADNIDGLAGQKQELVNLVNHLEDASTAYGMQISAEETQLMTNNTNGISTDITIDNKKLETVRSFIYLGGILSDEESKPEVLSRIAQTTAAVIKLKVIWNDKNIAISSKIGLMRSMAMSIFFNACETWTMTADIERRIQALEMRCFRKLLGISYRDHITNEEVKARIGNAIGPYEDLLTSVKRRKLKWYGHVHTVIWTGQDYPTGNSSWRETKRQTEETMGKQHQRVDWP